MLLDKLEESMADLSSKTNQLNKKILKALQTTPEKLVKHYKSTWIYSSVLIVDPRHKVEQFQKTFWGREISEYSKTTFENIYRTKYYDPEEVKVK